MRLDDGFAEPATDERDALPELPSLTRPRRKKNGDPSPAAWAALC